MKRTNEYERRATVTIMTMLATMAFTQTSRAAPEDDTPSPEPLDDESISDWDHFELSMGFFGGQRRYGESNFEWRDGGDMPGVRSLTKPFTSAPFDKLHMAGLRYDARLVVSYVRMTTGVDIPFPIYRTDQSVGVYDVGGVARRVSVRSIRPFDLRFGLGAEYPIGPVAPFFDVLGGVHWVNANLDIDGSKHSYQAVGFALSGRLGARLHVRRWFFASIAGEMGFIGDVRWGAELAVGFALM
jgi:hypothetical protein